jgi:hypothetical protein
VPVIGASRLHSARVAAECQMGKRAAADLPHYSVADGGVPAHLAALAQR